MKQCNSCKQNKPLIEYGKDKKNKTGLNYICKECNRNKSKISGKSITSRYSIAKSNTIKYRPHLEFSITLEQYQEIIIKVCHYCQRDLNEYGSGLDRKDNSKGYTLENAVPCCAECNTTKSDYLSEGEMLVVAKALKKYRKKHKILDNSK